MVQSDSQKVLKMKMVQNGGWVGQANHFVPLGEGGGGAGGQLCVATHMQSYAFCGQEINGSVEQLVIYPYPCDRIPPHMITP